MSTPGAGGTPPAPAGYVPPALPSVAAGSALVLRGRLVIVSGPSGTIEGFFMYAPGTTPGPGNPPIVAITTSSTDPYGNSVQPADSPATTPELIILGSAGSYLQLATQAGSAVLLLGTGDASESIPGILDSVISGAGGTRQLVTELRSPDFPAVNPSAIQLFSDSFDGTVKSIIKLNSVNRTQFGLSGNAWWADNTGVSGQLNLPASGGPFIFGESFHAVSNGTNISGTIQVKKTPWNAIWMDIFISYGATANATITCGSLPDLSYYPLADRRFPLAYGGTPTTVGNVNARVFVPNSGVGGGIQIVFPAMSATGAPFGASFMYPTN